MREARRDPWPPPKPYGHSPVSPMAENATLWPQGADPMGAHGATLWPLPYPTPEAANPPYGR